jgi:hypothetical protein
LSSRSFVFENFIRDFAVQRSMPSIEVAVVLPGLQFQVNIVGIVQQLVELHVISLM